MKILINGCSFTQPDFSWANHIAKQFNAELINLAMSAAGNTYISNATMSELQERQYDLVLIMWSGLERVDIRVSDINQFEQSGYISGNQYIRGHRYAQQNWVFGVGHKNLDPLLNSNVYRAYFKYQDLLDHAAKSFYNMLSLESYLKSRNIPYAFSFYQNYINDLGKYSDQLDWNFIFNSPNITDLATKINDFENDGIHPGPSAHEYWSKEFFNFLAQRYPNLVVS